MSYIEKDCTVKHKDKEFTAGGAIVSDDYCICYPGKDGRLNDWHGRQIGVYKIVSSRPAVFFGYRSYMADRYYYMRAKIDGRVYAIRGFGIGMIARGKRIKSHF